MKILAGNWKLNKLRSDVDAFFKEVGTNLPKGPRYIIAPSPTLLETAVKTAKSSSVEIFAQNCHWEKSGAFTGECSALQLKDLGCTGTLVGHSERRQFFGDTDDTVKRRALAALSEGLDVIFCIGESKDERQSGQTEKVLERQLQGPISILKDHPTLIRPGQFLLAYEPVWAIGTGLTATSEQIEAAHRFIEQCLTHASVKPVPCLYGGSVKTSNFSEISRLRGVSGGLVGGASLSPADYLALARALT